MSNSFVKTLNPKRGEKYSPNLYRWLLKNYVPQIQVFRNRKGCLYIGWIYEGDLIGSKVISVLCNGGREHPYSYTGAASEMKQEKNFWAEYARIGRCAIDKNHSEHFMNAEGRWLYRGKTKRTCAWCGHKQIMVKHKRVVIKEIWKSEEADHA